MNNSDVRGAETLEEIGSSNPIFAKAALTREYFEGPSVLRDDVKIRGRYFFYDSPVGAVAGCDFSVMFSLGASAKVVWPYLKDFNLWQNDHGHYYSGVVGDLEGRTFRISLKRDEPGPHQYRVLKVIPEHLIVAYQPIPEGGAKEVYLPGHGDVSPGFHVVMLNEHRAGTDINFFMEHASCMERRDDGRAISAEEALRPWRSEAMVPEWLRKWRDDFIPTLKRIVHASSNQDVPTENARRT